MRLHLKNKKSLRKLKNLKIKKHQRKYQSHNLKLNLKMSQVMLTSSKKNMMKMFLKLNKNKKVRKINQKLLTQMLLLTEYNYKPRQYTLSPKYKIKNLL